MPGMWSGHEKLSRTQYQIVTILSLLCNRPWLGGRLSRFCSDLPIFVVYRTGPGGFQFLSTEEGDPGASLSA